MTARHAVDLSALLAADRRTLARAITLVESTHPDDQDAAKTLLESVLPHTGNSLRIGISGPPGVGKSTFIESFGLAAIAEGHKVAVLAVDPSSPIAGGSILGDKTRMEKLSCSAEAYIRPTPSSGALGGVARHTREAVLLCEAAGFDLLLVETVGVGQSEIDVADMVDFFLVMIPPNAGDELQGIKKGILELTDALIINKADSGNENRARETLAAYQSAFKLISSDRSWQPQVLTCSAITGEGIDAILQLIHSYTEQMKQSGGLESRRESQRVSWLRKLTNEALARRLRDNEEVAARIASLEHEVISGQMTPLNAVDQIIEWFDARR